MINQEVIAVHKKAFKQLKKYVMYGHNKSSYMDANLGEKLKKYNPVNKEDHNLSLFSSIGLDANGFYLFLRNGINTYPVASWSVEQLQIMESIKLRYVDKENVLETVYKDDIPSDFSLAGYKLIKVQLLYNENASGVVELDDRFYWQELNDPTNTGKSGWYWIP